MLIRLLVTMILPPAVYGFSKTYFKPGNDVRYTIRPGTGGINKSSGGGRTMHRRRRQRLTAKQTYPGQQLSGGTVFLSMTLRPQENSGEKNEGSINDETRTTVLSSQETTQPQPQSPPPSTPPPDDTTTETISIEERFNKLLDSVDEFLDTPFFDPDQYLDDDNEINASSSKNSKIDSKGLNGDEDIGDSSSTNNNDDGLVTKFARLVKEDYELAETLFVGTFFVILIIGTQELLRMQLYGDSYVPFLPHPSSYGGGSNGGRLF